MLTVGHGIYLLELLGRLPHLRVKCDTELMCEGLDWYPGAEALSLRSVEVPDDTVEYPLARRCPK